MLPDLHSAIGGHAIGRWQGMARQHDRCRPTPCPYRFVPVLRYLSIRSLGVDWVRLIDHHPKIVFDNVIASCYGGNTNKKFAAPSVTSTDGRLTTQTGQAVWELRTIVPSFRRSDQTATALRPLWLGEGGFLLPTASPRQRRRSCFWFLFFGTMVDRIHVGRSTGVERRIMLAPLLPWFPAHSMI